MDAKEAIARIKNHFAVHDDGRPTPYLDEAVSMAINALRRQIPMKVSIINWNPAKCPSCGCVLSEHLGDGYYHHFTHLRICPNEECNQRLMWEQNSDSRS